MAKSELSNHQISEQRLPPSSPRAAPWLVTPHGKDCKFQTFYNLCDPLQKSYQKFIPELSGKIFWQKNCHQGWLIIVHNQDVEDPNFNSGDCFLWNPSSLEIIMLPNLDQFNKLDGYRVKDCLLSSPPPHSCSISTGTGDGIESSSSSSSFDDSMVYILYDGGQSPDILIYCHPGEKQWRKHEFVDLIGRLQTIFYFRCKLYIVSMGVELLEITIQQDSSIRVSALVTKEENSYVELERLGGSSGYSLCSYYMESFGDVYRIQRFQVERNDHKHFLTLFVVSKLNFDLLTWEEVKVLNDHVFFIDYFMTTKLSCLASDMGLSKGCVYFTLISCLSLYKYDMEDDSILLSIPCPDIPKPWLSTSWMMIPTTSRVADSRTTTDLMLGKDEDIQKVIKGMENQASNVDKDSDTVKVEEARLLMKLGDDIAWAMSKFLYRVDCIHLRAVSKKYRSLIDLRRYSSTRTIQTAERCPWLFFPKNDQSIVNFINPMYGNENYLLNIPELLKGSRIRFSKGGWLLMSKRNSLFFYNPFMKSIIRLPDLPTDSHYYGFTGISFSSLPTASDCLVFAIDKEWFSNQVHIFFIKRGDKDWSHNLHSSMNFESTLNNPVFYQGRFYCLDHNGALGVFKYEQPNVSWEILSMITPPKCGLNYNSFLVEFEGKLLSVLVGRLGRWVRIFILDESKMIWVGVKHLGQHMLFLSSTSCILALAPTSQMENKVYFPRLHNEGILYYSLDTGTYHSVGSCHSAKDFRDSKEKLHCSWIEPNWSEIPDHYLDWLNI